MDIKYNKNIVIKYIKFYFIIDTKNGYPDKIPPEKIPPEKIPPKKSL